MRNGPMNKMLVAVFDSETAASEGLGGLKELHKNGDITLFATTVLTKDKAGNVIVKQAVDRGPAGTALGFLTGALIGVLGGPVGLPIGAAIGGRTGLVFDLDKSGIRLTCV